MARVTDTPTLELAERSHAMKLLHQQDRGELVAEVAYVCRQFCPLGFETESFVRVDIVLGSTGRPTAVYEFVFASAGSGAEVEYRLRANLPFDTRVFKVRPNT